MAVPQKVKGLLIKIVNHGDGVYTVLFSVPKRYNRFTPGQFAHLTLDEFDPTMGFWPESRVFSIASEPKTEELKIVYSVKGKYTKRMESELTEGKEYWLKLPYGDFTIENRVSEDQDIVLIAGGTGVSPFIPYLVDANMSYPSKIVFLYYGFRNKNHKLFESDIKKAQSLMANLVVKYYSEENVEENGIIHGRLDINRIYKETKDLNAPLYFISGPPNMINNFKEKLLELNVEANYIQIDEWE